MFPFVFSLNALFLGCILEEGPFLDTAQPLSCGADADGDGYYNAQALSEADGTCPSGTLSTDSAEEDCDDGDASVSPEGEEVCGDGIDQDCSGADLECPEPETMNVQFVNGFETAITLSAEGMSDVLVQPKQATANVAIPLDVDLVIAWDGVQQDSIPAGTLADGEILIFRFLLDGERTFELGPQDWNVTENSAERTVNIYNTAPHLASIDIDWADGETLVYGDRVDADGAHLGRSQTIALRAEDACLAVDYGDGAAASWDATEYTSTGSERVVNLIQGCSGVCEDAEHLWMLPVLPGVASTALAAQAACVQVETHDHSDSAIDASATVTAGSATIADGVATLTTAGTDQAGAVYLPERVPLDESFSVRFSFRMSEAGGLLDANRNTGGDGLALLLHNHPEGLSALSSGGGIGYSGLEVAAAVEFDTWDNGVDRNDSGSNHVDVMHNDLPSTPLSSVHTVTPVDAGYQLDDGREYTAWVDYDGTHITVYLADSETKPSSPLMTEEVDVRNSIAGGVGYLAIAASTGGAYHKTEVLSWSYTGSGTY